MRLIAFIVLAACAATALPRSSSAEAPVKIIASAPPGTPVDIRARWVAERLSAALGAPVVVENRPGAGGNIGMQAAARSAPDGRTFVIVHQGTLAINPHLYARAGYDPIGDFAPITRLVDSPLVLAVPGDSPVRTVQDMVALAKRNPDQLSYGSSGIGTPPHLAGELFCRSAGIQVLHVPYKGAAASLTDLLAGRVAFTIDSMSVHMPQVRAGRLRALAVTSASRLADFPDLPTVAESGVPGFEYMSWMGVAAPAGTPAPVIARVHDALVRELGSREAQEWFKAQGSVIVGDTPEAFAAFIRGEHAKWGRIIRAAGIKAD